MPDGVWTSRTYMPLPARRWLAGGNIGDEKGYALCGYDDPTYLRDNDEYNRVGDFWDSKADAPSPSRHSLGVATIGTDKLYLFCGKSPGNLDDTDEYSQVGDSWTNKTDITGYDRSHPSAFAIGLDKAYVCSGNRSGPVQNLDDCVEYSQSGNSWTDMTPVPSPLRMTAAGFTIDSKGYTAAGTSATDDNSGGIYDLDRYDQTGNSWLSMADCPDPSRRAPGGCSMKLSGYIQGGSNAVQDCDEYDSTENQWSNKTDMPAPGRTEAATMGLGDNECYLIGGRDSGYVRLQDCDEFHLPNVPWVENLSPPSGTIDVPVDANIEFDVLDDTGVDQNTITVKVGDVYAIIDGVFQAGFTGTITVI